MAESKNAKKAAAAAASAESAEATPQEHARKEKKKSRWTLATCMNASKRFATREEWSKGAPSSFKAAVAKGWDKECCKHMTAARAVVKSTSTKSKPKTTRMPKAS